MPGDLPILSLANAALWRQWLAREGATSKGVMLLIVVQNKASPITTLTYPEALDEALCQGWIDSGGRKNNETTRFCRFGPRLAKGMWSQRNVGFIERLEKAGRMLPAGQAAVEAAQADGRWAKAYTCSGDVEPHPNFLAALEENPAAKATWNTLNKGNRWFIYFRLLNLKTEVGREKSIERFIGMLARGEMPKPPEKGSKVKTKSASKRRPDETSSPEEGIREKQPGRKTRSGRTMP
ncbi:Hypothetical protein R9X50_00120100 [Acrodontium crateriforme]|uniref:Uncharacterized protein n=1 Tax=Acrodontium crateriforme TaxID=150365 RepID=A0AAQ3M4N7_9PEZI|nr:Hypothetical protein R9X50_00120100 [Acrodontium crateriforme]